MAAHITVELGSLAETERLGRFLGEIAEAGDVIILNGPLGAGKTTISQFIGAGLEVPGECYITSPTFSLMHEYPGRLTIYHMDLYRLSSEEEIEDLGFVECIYGQGLTIIEWPDRLGEMLPDEHLDITLEMTGEDCRTAEISAHGEKWQKRLAGINSLSS
jgi:tRNA threonylcarbamoyladenosine biosynthesis protein TsaE